MPRNTSFMVSGPSNVLTFAPLREQIGRLLDDLVQGLPLSTSTDGSFEFSPSTEVVESESEVWINVELPGILIEDVSILGTAHAIVVSGQKRSTVRRNGDEKYFSNREFGAFSQTFTLSSPINPDMVTAELGAGVLSIRVPKAANLVVPTRTIPITTETPLERSVMRRPDFPA